MYKEWSKREEKLLLYEFENNIDIAIIKSYHNRSKADIQQKILDIASQMFDKDISIFTIYKKTKIEYKILLKLYNKKKHKKQSLKHVIKSIQEDLILIKNKLDIE